MRTIIIIALLYSPAIFAADCYISHCRVDKDGTVWCYNEEVDCGSLQNLQCARNCNDEKTLQCSADTVNDGEPVSVVITPHYEKPPYDGPTGGIGGEGADGGLWEHSGVYRTLRSDSPADWPEDADY
jgi:hypothetical protein